MASADDDERNRQIAGTHPKAVPLATNGCHQRGGEDAGANTKGPGTCMVEGGGI